MGEIPLIQRYEETAMLGFSGEFFVRKDPFSNLGLAHRLSRRGFLVKTASISEWMYYVNYLIKQKMIQPDFTFYHAPGIHSVRCQPAHN